MKKEHKVKHSNNNDDIADNKVESSTEQAFETESVQQGDSGSGTDDIKEQLEQKSKQCDEYFGKLQRMAAEFDNYKKRTAREREALCDDVAGDVILAFLPVVDNLERALQTAPGSEEGSKSIREGVEMVYRQIRDALKKLGVEEVKSVGENFDPLLHNAVMHVEDEAAGENVIVEEFQKGYTVKGKVVRHSMVKVAN